ncbi:MAG: MarR family transcriptional regulator [Planctomycetia bacterium]|nr:MarR family transcriptional regulator [Planctomycetia bacterium]
METLISHAGMRVLQHLVGFEPKTVDQLMKELHVTRTAVVEQLNELSTAGFVERVPEEPPLGTTPKRGRPRFRYYATSGALARFFPGNQHLLVPAVWSAIEKIGGHDLLESVVEATAQGLAENCLAVGLPWQKRVQLLVSTGGFDDVEFCDDGSVLVSKRTCKMHSMYESSGTVCEIHLKTIAKILGAQVERVEYRHDDAPCCRFRLRGTETEGESSH